MTEVNDRHSESLSSKQFSSLLSSLDLRIFPELWDEHDAEAQNLLLQMSRTPGSCQADPDLDEPTLEKLNSLRTDLQTYFAELQQSEEECSEVTCLNWIQRTFHLSQTEMDMLLVCAAPEADRRYQNIYAHLQNRRMTAPSADLILLLCVPDGIGRLAYLPLLQAGHSLIDNRLLERLPDASTPELNTCFRLADGMIECLSGVWRSDIYKGQAELLLEPKPEMSTRDLPIPECDEEGKVPMLSVYGADLCVQENAVLALAQCMQRPLLRLDLSAEEDQTLCERLLGFALRDAALLNALLLVDGMDRHIEPGGILPVKFEKTVMRSELVVIFNTRHEFVFAPDLPAEHRVMLRVPFDGLTGAQRLTIWKGQLSAVDLAHLSNESLRLLSGQFVLTSAQIRTAAATARGLALSAGRSIEIKDLYAGARLSCMHHLDDLACKMPPRYDRKDLFLPQMQMEQLDELIAMARNRSLVLEEWGVGKKLASGSGIAALFTGPPGTGKTLSAQVTAGELGLDLYRIDLSTVVSKYIGETEKNLEKIFSEAQNSNVILFFDEADALFGKRSDVSDAHDRYANIEVGYLLQRIETYNGLAILATNLGSNLDEAFTRRLHFIINFPFPDEATRLRLWQMLIPLEVRHEADLGLEALARSYRIAGGNIRNAIISGIYRAAKEGHLLCNEDLRHGIYREYQKMGRVYKDE